jgi:Holliday junction resolvase RusA-like endonuclease
VPIRAEIKAYFWPSRALIDKVMKSRMKELGLKKKDLQTESLCQGLIDYCDLVLEETPMISKPDWDNTGKLLSDALNKIGYYDDSAIYDSHVMKWYSRKPRLEITLEAFI